MAGKPVVVGVEGSPESRRALELASQIAVASHVDIVAVHAVPDLWLVGLDSVPVILPEVFDMLVQASRQQFERLLAEVVPAGVHARLEVRTGQAATGIADAARRRRAAFVVLGGKRHSALERMLGRSTAHYLVRTLDVPLLVVGPAAAPVARVLAAVDLSAAALPTIRAALRIAALFGARVRVVHIVEPLHLMFESAGPPHQEQFEERSRAAFAQLTKPIGEIPDEDRLVRIGPAAETLLAEAIAWRADILVVGSHGKGWVDRVLVGSTTERLLNALPTSLLVIPTAATLQRQPVRRHRRRSRARPRGTPSTNKRRRR